MVGSTRPFTFDHAEYERIRRLCLWQRQQLAELRDYLAKQRQQMAALQAACEEQRIACEIRRELKNLSGP